MIRGMCMLRNILSLRHKSSYGEFHKAKKGDYFIKC